MLKKEDFIDNDNDDSSTFFAWWTALVIATNEAIFSFSRRLGISFIDSIGAIRYSKRSPNENYGVFCSMVVISCLFGITYCAYKKAKARPDYEKITIKNSFKTYSIFLAKYVLYSSIFMISLHIAYSILRWIF